VGVTDDVAVTSLTYRLNDAVSRTPYPNAVARASNGAFDFTLTLREGTNTVVLEAGDAAGNRTRATIQLTYAPDVVDLRPAIRLHQAGRARTARAGRTAATGARRGHPGCQIGC
jgi:hypothetical protein